MMSLLPPPLGEKKKILFFYYFKHAQSEESKMNLQTWTEQPKHRNFQRCTCWFFTQNTHTKPHTHSHTHGCEYREMSPYSCKLLASHFHAKPHCPSGTWREEKLGCVCVFFGQLFKVENCPRQSRLSGRRQADNGGASVCQGLHLKVTHTHAQIGTNKHTHLSHTHPCPHYIHFCPSVVLFIISTFI